METFFDKSAQPAVRGFLHQPAPGNSDALVLTHGAGANCQSKLMIAVANAFAASGFTVLRCDLPFRQQRPHGPPLPGGAAHDREELRPAHFPQLRTPALFVHGSRDPFGSLDEMKSALQLIPAAKMLLEVAGAGHELLSAKGAGDLPEQIMEAFSKFFS